MKKLFSLKTFAVLFISLSAFLAFAVASYSGEDIKITNVEKVDQSLEADAENDDTSEGDSVDGNDPITVGDVKAYTIKEGSSLPDIFPGSDGKSIGEAFVGEVFTYDVSFWILDNVAVGKLSIERGEKPGEYIATMEAQTKGILAWFMKHRKDVYTSKVVEIDGGKRFRTVSFENKSIVGKDFRRTLQWLDYKNQKYYKKVWDNKGKLKKEYERDIPKGVSYDDPVAGFYNLRYGAYGEIKPGADLKILGLPKRDDLVMTVTVATEKDFKKRINKNEFGAKYICDIQIDKELFDSKSGKIEMHLTENMKPVVSIAKDVMMFGDVRGVLKYGRHVAEAEPAEKKDEAKDEAGEEGKLSTEEDTSMEKKLDEKTSDTSTEKKTEAETQSKPIVETPS